MQAPTGLDHIPAMTTAAERECYYRLVREALAAPSPGAIVELGAWLGASTAYIAAAVRDSHIDTKVHVFDKFQSKPGHERKVSAFYEKAGTTTIPIGPSLEQFRANLGELMRHVRVQRGQIEALEWDGGPISVLITDAPKRVPAISAVLTRLREAIVPGTIMAWQDFCHFPSYEIPACLYRLRDHLELVDAVVPGTTLVFRVKSQWTAEEVSLQALSLHRWSAAEIVEAWDWWLANGVPAEKAALFRCGAAMFACDIGLSGEAVAALAAVKAGEHADVEKKWAYLRENRLDFVRRYAPLFELMNPRPSPATSLRSRMERA
jgi:hypothetical protein